MKEEKAMPKMDRLERYLMSIMSAYDWKYPIGSQLGWSKMRLGKYCAYPHNVPFDKAIELAEFLEKEAEIKVGVKTRVGILVQVYSVSKNKISHTDYERWIK